MTLLLGQNLEPARSIRGANKSAGQQYRAADCDPEETDCDAGKRDALGVLEAICTIDSATGTAGRNCLKIGGSSAASKGHSCAERNPKV